MNNIIVIKNKEINIFRIRSRMFSLPFIWIILLIIVIIVSLMEHIVNEF